MKLNLSNGSPEIKKAPSRTVSVYILSNWKSYMKKKEKEKTEKKSSNSSNKSKSWFYDSINEIPIVFSS